MPEFRIYDLLIEVPQHLLSPAVEKGLSKGWYERDEVEAARSRLVPGDRVVELGAGLGVTALVAARIVGGDAVTAFEANPALIPVAEANARLNNLTPAFRNEVLVPASKMPPTGAIAVDIAEQFWATKVGPGGTTGVKIPARPLEDVLAATRANVLIMDIEGFEVEIIENCNLDPIDKLIFESHYGAVGRARTDAAIHRLEKSGFAIDYSLSSRGVLYLDRFGRA